MKDLEKRAREIISKILYITIATSTKDGKPWNSPVYCAFDKNYNFFWISNKNGQHSKNIRENNDIFIVIYDSTAHAGTGEGVYIKAKAYELIEEKDLTRALSCVYGRVGEKPPLLVKFLGSMPRRVYKAVPEKIWINGDGKKDGDYIDIRIEVNLLQNS